MMIMTMTIDRSTDDSGGKEEGRKEELAGARRWRARSIAPGAGAERSGKEDEEKFPSDETGTSGEVAATTNNKANDARRRTTAGRSRKDEEEDDNGGGAAWYECALEDVNHADCPGRNEGRRSAQACTTHLHPPTFRLLSLSLPSPPFTFLLLLASFIFS